MDGSLSQLRPGGRPLWLGVSEEDTWCGWLSLSLRPGPLWLGVSEEDSGWILGQCLMYLSRCTLYSSTCMFLCIYLLVMLCRCRFVDVAILPIYLFYICTFDYVIISHFLVLIFNYLELRDFNSNHFPEEQ